MDLSDDGLRTQIDRLLTASLRARDARRALTDRLTMNAIALRDAAQAEQREKDATISANNVGDEFTRYVCEEIAAAIRASGASGARE